MCDDLMIATVAHRSAAQDDNGFVHELARHLIGNEHDADDVAQRVRLAWLRRPPGTIGPLQAWLNRVTRNITADLLRRRQRCSSRELAVARSERVPSVIESLEREWTRTRVLDAVRTLEEPYRSAIEVRFLEELPPRAVAARLGVPVETARTRIKRALTLLRRHLERGSVT